MMIKGCIFREIDMICMCWVVVGVHCDVTKSPKLIGIVVKRQEGF